MVGSTRARVIYRTNNGFTFRIYGDETIHIEFLNVICKLNPVDFRRFKKFILSLNTQEIESDHAGSIHTRRIIIEINKSGIMFAFLKREFLEFRLLLEGTDAMLKLFEYARKAKVTLN